MQSLKNLYFTLLAVTHVRAEDFLPFLQSDSQLTNLHSTIIRLPDFARQIESIRPISILAPTNDAFERLDKSSPEGVALNSGDIPGIEATLSYHFTPYAISSINLLDHFTYGRTLLITGNTTGDELAALMPTGVFVGTRLVDGTMSVKSGLEKICKVTQADIKPVTDVTIHKIDCVLTLPVSVTATANALGGKTFKSLLVSTGLANAFDYAPHSTVFVPTDAVFQAASPATKGLTGAALKSLLKNHISIGDFVLTATILGRPWFTWAGNPIFMMTEREKVVVNKSRLTVTNILVKNGVVHLIDS